jgi:hypothetical protein
MNTALLRHSDPPRRVNPRSRLFALAALVLSSSLPAVAEADRVVLYSVTGRADDARLAEVEAQLAAVLREQAHTLVLPPSASRPLSSAEMEATASAVNATYVVVPEVEPLPGQYRLSLHVYYRPNARLEELVVNVLLSEERARLSDVLSSMLRRQGLGDDALRLTGEPGPTATSGESEEERARRESEERARRESEERARRESEERARRESEERARRESEERARRESEERAWAERRPYGDDGAWMVQLAVGGGYATRLGALPGALSSEGSLLDVGVRVGRTFEGLDGFELRGGLDVVTGTFAGPVIGDGTSPSVGYTGVALRVGAAWLGSFFPEPVYLGLGGEVGLIFTATGGRDVGFAGTLGALVAWRPVRSLVLEASLPELSVITPGAGALSVGASVRAGYRFD